MSLTKAPKAFPYTSVGVIEIFASGGETYRGSVFLIKTDKYDRQDIVLGAGHNLTHLSDSDSEVHVTFYNNRDVNSVATRGGGGFRYAIADSKMPSDFGVAVLAEALPGAIKPIPLTTPEDATTLEALVAGGVADNVAAGDRAIFENSAEMHVHGGVLYCDPGTTAQGMSGGPILESDGAKAIGVIHGTGTVKIGGGDPKPADLGVTFTADNIAEIDALIALALKD